MRRQPGPPQGPRPDPPQEDQLIVVDFRPVLTPEQRKWPVARLRGADPLPPEAGAAPESATTPPADAPRTDA